MFLAMLEQKKQKPGKSLKKIRAKTGLHRLFAYPIAIDRAWSN
tara:strand:+ start:559 stop:687 length:129 start_codon:yes stop_codon:yes gene_type:complete